VELAGSTPADLDVEERDSSQTFLSPQTSHEFNAESSTITRRPRARSDYSRQIVHREPKPRASIDVAPSSSKFGDGNIERNDSTASTQATVGVLTVARKCRATSIDIQRHSEKHRSLPSELPYLKSQPSLIDDLADYIMPSAASERLPSKEWPNTPTIKVPSISVTSSPTTCQALPVVPETTSMANATISGLPNSAIETIGAHVPSHQLGTSSGGPAQPPQHGKGDVTLSMTEDDVSLRQASTASAERTASPMSHYATSVHTLRSPNSVVNVTVFTDDEPIRRPSSQRPSQRMSKRLSQTSSTRTLSAAPSPTIAAVAGTPTTLTSDEQTQTHDETISPSATPLLTPQNIAPESSQPELAVPTEEPEELDDDDDEVVLSVLQQRLRSHKVVKTMAEDLVRQASSAGTAQKPVDTDQPILSSPVLHEQPITTPRQELHIEVPTTSSSVPVQIEVPSTVPSASVQIEVTPVPSIEDQNVPANADQPGEAVKKPMSAQAKRRAAHARRMQLAFGDESTA
jgi:hypothetical protein